MCKWDPLKYSKVNTPLKMALGPKFELTADMIH